MKAFDKTKKTNCGPHSNKEEAVGPGGYVKRVCSSSSPLSNFVDITVRSLDRRSYLTESSIWVCGSPTRSAALLRSGVWAFERPLANFHISRGRGFSSGGAPAPCSPPSLIGV